ncbi:MAG: GuaB3 family IMP dehydrogenase-related protein [Chloroflexi bacterium]|nr:GuaB3 family IMP dehydrogenase-related protein [Chloroflexota bacterium]
MGVPQFKEIRRAYGYDEVAIVPGQVTINPDQTNIEFTLGPHKSAIPFLASSMDAVVSPKVAVLMGKLGGIGVLNLEGVWTRYEDADSVLVEVAAAPQDKATGLLQKVYSAPMKDNLVGQRVQEIKQGGATAAVALTPQNTKRIAPLAQEAGADILVVQATVTTARHISKSYRGLIFAELVESLRIPVIVGNCVTYGAALELMETGVNGLLIGVGPGAACTTREVVGVGVPQISATMDCAAAREEYSRRTGRYVPIITDGGIRTGGDVCKSFVAGADAVMLGTPFAQATEAPGRGYNWGMATPHAALPRGTRIRVGTKASLEQILFGPSNVTDGTMNLVSAMRVGMGMVGAFTIREFQQAELVYAPDIKAEGKVFQMAQGR